MGLLFREHPKAQPEGGFCELPAVKSWVLFKVLSCLVLTLFQTFKNKLNKQIQRICVPRLDSLVTQI